MILLPDQWRGDWLGCHDDATPYGKSPVRTPNIDALAARGMRMRRAYTNAPICAPARACLALGRQRCHTGVWNNGDDTPLDEPTLFNHLQARGYRTLTCGKNDLHKPSGDYTQSGWAARLAAYGFSDAIDFRGKMNAGRHIGDPNRQCPYFAHLRARGLDKIFDEDYRRRRTEPFDWFNSDWPSPLERKDFCDDFCGQSAIKLLHRTPKDGPWCLWVNFPGPHDPHDPPRELQARYDDVQFPPPIRGKAEHKGEPLKHQQLRKNYAASCEGIDDWVGWILDAVEQRGELDRTIVIFASDHGEMLGDHGRWAKSVWYEPSVHVPMIVAGPGVQQGQVSDALVELIDVHASCLDWAGAAPDRRSDARSMLPILTGQSDQHRPAAVSALGGWRMATDARWKLVVQEPDKCLGDTQPVVLIDRRAGCAETANCAAKRPEVVQRLVQYLDEQSPTEIRQRNRALSL